LALLHNSLLYKNIINHLIFCNSAPFNYLAKLLINNADLNQSCLEGRANITLNKSDDGEITCTVGITQPEVVMELKNAHN